MWMIPVKVRVSTGTAGLLGLDNIKLKVKPTTAYLMTHTDDGCVGNCTFCPQARESPSSKSRLSRVLWPTYPSAAVLAALGNAPRQELKRICIQAVNYPGYFEDVHALLRGMRAATDTPVSLDTCPLTREQMRKLKEAGLDRIGIPLDASTPGLFDRVKGSEVGGPFSWDDHMEALREAVEVFGRGRVMSNLIVGIGETEEEAANFIQTLMDMGVQTGLFAFTPIRGTTLHGHSQPPLDSYRRVQVARHLITLRHARSDDMEFDDGGAIVGFGADPNVFAGVLEKGDAFCTSGCPGCNRPFYNERPSGPLFNYPRGLTREEAQREAERLGLKNWVTRD
jgi:biotin synthase